MVLIDWYIGKQENQGCRIRLLAKKMLMQFYQSHDLFLHLVGIVQKAKAGLQLL